MKHVFHLIGFLLTTTVIMGQDSTTRRSSVYRVILKVAPLALLDPDNTFQAGVEVRMNRRLAVQTEFGYGTGPQLVGFGPSPWTPNSYVRGKEVWRVRSEVRYYTQSLAILATERSILYGSYVAVEGLYKRVNVAQVDTVMGSETADRVFVRAPVSRHIIALHSKIGRQSVLSYDSNQFLSRFIIDTYIGLGIRYISVVENGIEAVNLFKSKIIYERSRYYYDRPGDTFWRPSISVGMKIGFAL